MNRVEDRATRTKRVLLEQACRIFAEKGFHETTVAEICSEAEANIAAVNYHFGSKKVLYVEAWRSSMEQSLAKYPPDGGISPGAPPEQRLRGRITSLMQRVADMETHAFDIVHKEMASPTGLLTNVMQELLEPLRIEFRVLIAELLGKKATAQEIELCHMSIRSQCFGPLLRERRRKKAGHLRPARKCERLAAGVDVLAEHVTCFSLAGIGEMARTIAKRKRQPIGRPGK
jgi:AcrR family transcriptional regulator